MRVLETALAGVFIVEPTVHQDDRGFFLEAYHAQRYAEHGIAAAFVQDNHSRSKRGTLRGLHWQDPNPQGKLVRAIEGEIYDVAVDIQPDSSSFGRWIAVTLSSENFLQLYVPPGYAHGFCVVSDVAQVEYKCTTFYDAASERGLRWNDPDVGIVWPIADPILSTRDQGHPRLRELRLR